MDMHGALLHLWAPVCYCVALLTVFLMRNTFSSREAELAETTLTETDPISAIYSCIEISPRVLRLLTRKPVVVFQDYQVSVSPLLTDPVGPWQNGLNLNLDLSSLLVSQCYRPTSKQNLSGTVGPAVKLLESARTNLNND